MSWSVTAIGKRDAVRKKLEVYDGYAPNDKSHVNDVRPLILSMMDHNPAAVIEVQASGHRSAPGDLGETFHCNVKPIYGFLD